MAVLRKIRIGTDITLGITVMASGHAVDWDSQDIKHVYAFSDVQGQPVAEMSYEQRGSTLRCVFNAEDQNYVGAYRVIIEFNDGSAFSSTLDMPAFEIVRTSEEADIDTGEIVLDIDGSMRFYSLAEVIAKLEGLHTEVKAAASAAREASDNANAAAKKANDAAALANSNASKAEASNKVINDNERKRIDQETARESAEAERKRAELERQKGDESIAIKEAVRVRNEEVRETNEQTRESNELERRNAESARNRAETQRANSETKRISNETSRQAAENKRVAAETSRQEAETSRVNVESERVTEFARLKKESEEATKAASAVSDVVAEHTAKLAKIDQQIVYDVTANNGGATFDSLSALLSSANLSTLIPENVRCGGMSIRFVQTSDNKYIQARCMAQNFTTDVTQWQGVDEEPAAGSDNLIKSGGVYERIPRNTNKISTKIYVIDEYGNVIVDLSGGAVKTKKFDSEDINVRLKTTAQQIEDLNDQIQDIGELSVSNNLGNKRLLFEDSDGNVVIEIYNGAIKTKAFDSKTLPSFKYDNGNDISICDEFGNVVLSVKKGNIITKKFNSNDVNVLSLRVRELEKLSDGYDSLLARQTPAISWIDDDFDTYSAERLKKLNILKSWAIKNNIKPDIALIPDVTYTDAQRTDIESVYFNNERLALAMEFEYSGLHMLTHPIHYGIYGDVIKGDEYIRKDLFLSRKALLDAGFPGCDIFVYAGSSAGTPAVAEAAKAYYDVGIMPGGNASNVNLPTKQDRYKLVRFSLDDISETNTVSQIKQQIDKCIATGGWIIFITHVWLHTGDGTEPVDETSNSLSNVFNIIQYANQKVRIRPTQEVWREKKILWEYYK